MNVAVFVKHVPDTTEADLVVAADGRNLKAGDLPLAMNEWDRFALEEAVRLREETGGSVTALLLGPPEHEDSLRRCLAVGADRAVHVWDPALADPPPAVAAAALRRALGDERFDLYLCGALAGDDGYGLVGPWLAQDLGVPAITLVNRLELQGDGTLLCERELESGWGERVEVRLPALLTLQTGINEPRYVSILGIRKARSKPIETRDLSALGLAAAQLEPLAGLLERISLAPPPSGGGAEILTGSPDEVAARVAALLRDKGGVA